MPVTLIQASDITPEAADKTEGVERAIKAAVAQLQATGQKVTQKAIALFTGYSQQHISRFRNLLIMLIECPFSQMSKIPELQEEAQWLSQPLVADLPAQEMFQKLETLWSVYGSRDLSRLW